MDTHVWIRKDTRDKAKQLYAQLDLPVSVREQVSREALPELLRTGRKFHLIYIDGYHSGLVPTLDFGLTYHLLYDRGIMMIDDHVWPDITGVKKLCDRHCEIICECWKVACYRVRLS